MAIKYTPIPTACNRNQRFPSSLNRIPSTEHCGQCLAGGADNSTKAYNTYYIILYVYFGRDDDLVLSGHEVTIIEE